MNIPSRPLLLAVLCAAAAALGAPSARADEIVVRDLDGGQESTIRCFEVTSETWSEVKYKERERSAEKSVPTVSVVSITRSDKRAGADNLRRAIADLEGGNTREAARALQALSGGGWKEDLETGGRKYVPFGESDPSGRNKRPDWVSEYAHFFYAKAVFLAGGASKDKDLITEAWLAIDDVPVPKGDGKATTGGFLGRFAGGNSRFYPEALDIKAHVLTLLGRYDDAKATFEELHKEAVRLGLDPIWVYHGLAGVGEIAEAKGDLTGAVEAYRGAIQSLWVYLGQENRAWLRTRYGVYYNRARMHVAAVKLKEAEDRKAPAAFADLRQWIQGGMPDALRDEARSKNLSPAAVASLIAGARDPEVQAVAFNGLGLAYLNEPKPKYEEALLAFKAVAVRYFQDAEQHARALYYLAQAADGAAKAASGKAKTMYAALAEQAVKTLRSQHAESPWARK